MSKQTSAAGIEDKGYHHGDLRNALIAAGRALLAEEGLAGLDLRKVARRAGVSHAAPYRHFADKQALLAAIAEDGFMRLAEQTNAALATAAEDSRAQLLALALAYSRFAQANPAHMREMFSGLTIDRTAYPSLYTASKIAFAQTVALIERGQARGEIGPGDPTQLVVTTWSLIHGLSMLVIENQIPSARDDAAAIDLLISDAMRTLYDGLARPERTSNRPAHQGDHPE